MALWTDLVTPQELTTVARMALDERERERISLAQFLPNVTKYDTVVRLSASDNGLVDVAEYRAYDAETPIGGGSAGKRITVELPPLGQKTRVSEYDQLRTRGTGSDAMLRDAIGAETIKRAKAVADRMELMRGTVLTTGKAMINENKFIAESDFERDKSLTVTAGKLWSDATAAKPLEDIFAWQETYVERNGEPAAYAVASTKVINALSKSGAFLNPNSVRVRAGLDEINAVLETEGLPQLVRYDRLVRVAGKSTRVIPDSTLLLLPSDGSDLGATFWGTTLESFEPNYAIQEDDRPGIVAGAYKEDDPMGVWVKGAAIGMPILANANLTMAATVL